MIAEKNFKISNDIHELNEKQDQKTCHKIFEELKLAEIFYRDL
jgi:hypothetical protein